MVFISNLSSNINYPEEWKIFAIKTLSLYNFQNEVFILTKSLNIDWQNSQYNSKFYIFLSLRYQNLLQAYLFLGQLSSFAENIDENSKILFNFFLDCVFEECLVNIYMHII